MMMYEQVACPFHCRIILTIAVKPGELAGELEWIIVVVSRF
ncbi:hypothetical protein [Paenibacillus ihbetae]|nr:hypothetical protein [Paenibacillus ihbetae]